MIEGIAYLTGDSAKHPASLSLVGENDAVLRVGDHVVDAEVEKISVSDRIGKLPLQLRFPSGELFIPHNEANLPDCFKSSSSGWLTKLETNLGVVWGSVIAAVLVIALFFWIGIPALSKGIATSLPEEVPKMVGEHVLEQLDEGFFTESELTETRKAHITNQFNQVIERLPPMPITPKLQFRSWSKGPNAFAFSDGTVVLLDPLVELAQTDEQLESIILHELGHVYHQHVMTALVHSTMLSVTVALVTGESTGVIDMLTGFGVLLVSSGYSREAEEESDAFASQYLYERYGSAESQAEMFELMHAESRRTEMVEWLSSHPDTDSRIEAAKQFTPE
ncbi:M48 family metallopeptidase [Enterovibrio coralii]|uniref:Zn-dependent protease with chaperone function n=1 Tax=Enterovibrio coralii TaxID=294935 RepID=A0A135I4K1_9GAMM|nr:M48 family metallopeptidase [Enterovibrio coralii]KXF80358.1 Zn-dependent protease with chaperone function [Enterovibrio coralii]